GCWKQGRSLQVICGSRAGVQECHLMGLVETQPGGTHNWPVPYFTAFHLDQERRRNLRFYAEISGS
ncbi:MAG: hypothetical protein ACYCWN_13570, partial [Ferrimicrobium sp.]